jgi:hypothetical protein
MDVYKGFPGLNTSIILRTSNYTQLAIQPRIWKELSVYPIADLWHCNFSFGVRYNTHLRTVAPYPVKLLMYLRSSETVNSTLESQIEGQYVS